MLGTAVMLAVVVVTAGDPPTASGQQRETRHGQQDERDERKAMVHLRTLSLPKCWVLAGISMILSMFNRGPQ
jgi:hypothetical protein